MTKHEFTMQPLKDRYKAGRWTFKMLSEKTGCSAAALCDMFNGKYVPRVDNLMAICRALEISPLRLFVRVKEEK